MNEIFDISGQHNVVTNALSRIKAIAAPVTGDAFAAFQDDDNDLPIHPEGNSVRL
jgi:hypothetical protein